jgi:predicted phage tail protein
MGFKQRPDTLRSDDSFEGLLGLCAGPIKGPRRGLKSIYMNGTPLEDESGQQNFLDFQAIFADGDPLKFPQKAVMKLGQGGSPIPVNLTLRSVDHQDGAQRRR